MKIGGILKDFENKWVAMTKTKPQVVAFAKSYRALNGKLKKDQKQRVTVLKVPQFDRFYP